MTQTPAPQSAGPTPLQPPSAEQSHTDQTVIQTLESIVVAFILAFVFRAFVVEAFVIPTGSMAPTLLGRHMRAVDPYTGERFAVDVPERGLLTRPQDVAGAMAGLEWSAPAGTRLSPGDRILVLKYLYSFAQPQRWDVVVFKDPGTPQQNFIKRLVGLPGEQLLLIDGNLYVKPADDQPWGIARKTDHRMGDKVQRAVWRPLYHSRFVPVPTQEAAAAWSPPWRIVDGPWAAGREGRLPAATFYHLESSAGTIAFDFEAVINRPPGLYAYNQVRSRDEAPDQRIEDVRLAVTVVPEGDSLTVELATVARLDNVAGRPQRLTATLAADGSVRLGARDLETGATRSLAGAVAAPGPRRGTARRIELWLVDLEASVWVNGRQVLRHRFDLSIEAARAQPPPPLYPAELSIHLDGGPATLRDVEVDRDLYYLVVDGIYTYQDNDSDTPSQRLRPGHAVLVKDGGKRRGEPFVLQEDQFFCLGDNSPLSGDSRQWPGPDPWVGAMFLADDPTPAGVVPRQLMMGRAFFVYWPAPLSPVPSGPGVIPNFADMRFIH